MTNSQHCRHFLTMLEKLQNVEWVVMESGYALLLPPVNVCVKILKQKNI